MFFRKSGLFFLIILLLLFGCSKQQFVSYHDVERTNCVTITLTSGKVVEGTVFKIEPHQLIILMKDRTKKNVLKSSILEIKRKTPVYDDFGQGISEEEIESVKGSHNTVVYGIGGGLLSLGASFFIGSMIGHDMKEGGTVIAVTTVVGGGLGTVLFVNAGKRKDREVAIEKILEKRRLTEYQKRQVKPKEKSSEDIKELIRKEKEEQEKLRVEREELLRRIQESENNQ